MAKTQSLAKGVALFTSALAIVALSGCSAFADPTVERDAKLDVILQAVKSGDGDAFCAAVNAAAPATCTEPIISTSGLASAALQNIPLSETSDSHRITGANFSFELNSELVETSEGELYTFTNISYVIPRAELPFGGTFAGTALNPDESKPYMPSDVAPEIAASPSPDGYLATELMLTPWNNQIETGFAWSEEAPALLEAEALKTCQAETSVLDFDFFRSGSEGLDYQSDFVRSSRSISSLFNDGSEFERRPRIINDPSNLTFGDCVIEPAGIGVDLIQVKWSRSVQFEGTTGIKEGNPNSFFDLYTGEYVDMTFASGVFGEIFALDGGFGQVSLELGELTPEIPLSVIE